VSKTFGVFVKRANPSKSPGNPKGLLTKYSIKDALAIHIRHLLRAAKVRCYGLSPILVQLATTGAALNRRIKLVIRHANDYNRKRGFVHSKKLERHSGCGSISIKGEMTNSGEHVAIIRQNSRVYAKTRRR